MRIHSLKEEKEDLAKNLTLPNWSTAHIRVIAEKLLS